MHHTIRTCRVVLIICCLLIATGAHAGPRDHEDGFFLRLSAGAGSAGSKLDDGSDYLDLTGTGGDVNFAIGGMVAPNLALHGTIFGWSVTDPDVESSFGPSVELPGDLTAAALGVGVTWYFMPANLYLSASGGSGRLSLDLSGGPEGDTDRGIMLDLTLGKEWWVGDRWGLGLAGGLMYHSFGDPDVPENWTGTAFTLRFSATMN